MLIILSIGETPLLARIQPLAKLSFIQKALIGREKRISRVEKWDTSMFQRRAKQLNARCISLYMEQVVIQSTLGRSITALLHLITSSWSIQILKSGNSKARILMTRKLSWRILGWCQQLSKRWLSVWPALIILSCNNGLRIKRVVPNSLESTLLRMLIDYSLDMIVHQTHLFLKFSSHLERGALMP